MGEADPKAAGSQEQGKNYSAVNLVFKESKTPFRGVLTPVSFTNWLWWRCVRPRLEKTKAAGFPDVEGEFGIDDVEEIFGQFMPKDAELPGKNKEDDKKSKKGDKDDDKKSKKDDKKDKKGDKDEKGDKDKGKDDKKGKDSKDAKKKKDAVKLNK